MNRGLLLVGAIVVLSTAGSVVEADECNQCQPVSAENIPGGACSSDAECKGPTSDCQHCTFCQDTCECESDQDCVETFGAGSTCDKPVVRENQCVLPQPTPAPTMPTPSPTMVPTATPTPPPTLSGCSEATWSHSRTDLSAAGYGTGDGSCISLAPYSVDMSLYDSSDCSEAPSIPEQGFPADVCVDIGVINMQVKCTGFSLGTVTVGFYAPNNDCNGQVGQGLLKEYIRLSGECVPLGVMGLVSGKITCNGISDGAIALIIILSVMACCGGILLAKYLTIKKKFEQQKVNTDYVHAPEGVDC